MVSLADKEKVRGKSIEELWEMAISGRYDPEISKLAKIELDIRNNIEAIKISTNNLNTSKQLVYATWGLVATTAILAIITFVAIFIR